MKKKPGKYKVAGSSDLRAILEEQEFKCFFTGQELTPQTTSFDHRIPLSRSGTSLKENLCATTKTINRLKHDLTAEEFVDMCARVLSHTGRKYGYRLTKKKDEGGRRGS